ncbi:MAG: hypothetical protein HUN04_20265 [Desulfobacter sp.]|nr:MAG: hypothetical protein HUN04_20265 [Desulfobacter sp.]
MGNDWYYYSLMAKQKDMDFRREAELIRLRRAARPRNPGLAAGIRTRLGNLLIKAGEAVKPECAARSCS